MKTVLKVSIPHTNVQLEFKSNGNCLYLDGKQFGTVFEDERSYVNGVLDTLQAFTIFKIDYIE